MTDATIQSQAPVFTVDGSLTRTLGRDCVSLEIREGLGGLRTLEAHFLAVGAGDAGPPGRLRHLDGSTIDFGRTVKVAIGPDTGQRYAFEGTVSGIELIMADGEPQRVVALAEDALMRLRMARRLRSWTRVTDAELASGIAREHGLDADVQADGPRYDVVQQLNQSDLAFLRERARLIEAELWCTGATLHFRSRSVRDATEVTLTAGAQLLSARITADLAAQRSEVVVSGYDATQRQRISERVTKDVVETEAVRGRSGAALVTTALGGSATSRVREVPLTSEEAQAFARAEMLRRGRSFVTATGVTNGTPDLVVGTRLTLQLVGEPFEGDGYYVTAVRHRFDLVSGLRTEFTAQRATLNEVA